MPTELPTDKNNIFPNLFWHRYKNKSKQENNKVMRIAKHQRKFIFELKRDVLKSQMFIFHSNNMLCN